MRTTSTSTYKPRQIIIVHVPFSNHSGLKPRPALVVSIEEFHRKLSDIIICPVSSQPRYYQNPGKGDVPLLDWQKPGLRYPSTVRISRILSVDKQIIKGVLGIVSQRDYARVTDSVRDALGL
jgi:mRNA-degrading endonuclease toxin of MazEF toxin-antitoxin module